MLSSKSVQDTMEAIKLFQLLQQYGIENSENGIRKIITLIFSKDDLIIKAVVEFHETVYFNAQVTAPLKAQHLVGMMNAATLTEVTCIEELVNKLLERQIFDQHLIRELWGKYSGAEDAEQAREN